MKALIMTMKLGKVGLTRYLCQNLPELLIVRTVQVCLAEPTRRPCPRLQNVRSLSHTHTIYMRTYKGPLEFIILPGGTKKFIAHKCFNLLLYSNYY